MEPVGLAVGVLGLAGLFSSCLDVLERFDSWRDFGVDSRLLAARFKAEKIRLEQWGQAVGFGRGGLLNNHHTALDDPRMLSMVEELLSVIRDICHDEDVAFRPPVLGADSKPAKDWLFSRSHVYPKELLESKGKDFTGR